MQLRLCSAVLNMTCEYYCVFHVPTYVCLFFHLKKKSFSFFVVLYFSGLFFPISINRLAKSSNKCKVFQVLYLLLLLLLFSVDMRCWMRFLKQKKEQLQKNQWLVPAVWYITSTHMALIVSILVFFVFQIAKRYAFNSIQFNNSNSINTFIHMQTHIHVSYVGFVCKNIRKIHRLSTFALCILYINT